MKKLVLILTGGIGGFLLAVVLLHALPASDQVHFPHAAANENSESVNIQLNGHKNMVCGRPFFDSTYEFAKEIFSVGAENVVLSEFEEKSFNFIRTSATYKGDKEAYIKQIQELPKQIIDIVKEDPTVLDTCENFRIAMFGPL